VGLVARASQSHAWAPPEIHARPGGLATGARGQGSLGVQPGARVRLHAGQDGGRAAGARGRLHARLPDSTPGCHRVGSALKKCLK